MSNIADAIEYDGQPQRESGDVNTTSGFDAALARQAQTADAAPEPEKTAPSYNETLRNLSEAPAEQVWRDVLVDDATTPSIADDLEYGDREPTIEEQIAEQHRLQRELGYDPDRADAEASARRAREHAEREAHADERERVAILETDYEILTADSYEQEIEALARLRRQEDEGVVGSDATTLAAFRAAGIEDDELGEIEPGDPRLDEAAALLDAAERQYGSQLRTQLATTSAYARALEAQDAQDTARKNGSKFATEIREWAKTQSNLGTSDESIGLAVHAAAQALASEGVDIYGLIATNPEEALNHVIALESAASQFHKQELVRQFQQSVFTAGADIASGLKFGDEAKPPSLDDYEYKFDEPAAVKRATHRPQTVGELRAAVMEPEKTNLLDGLEYRGRDGRVLRGREAIKAGTAGTESRAAMLPGVHGPK